MDTLVADCGGTRIKLGIVRQRTVIARTVLPAHAAQGLGARLPVLRRAWDELGASIHASPAAVVLALPQVIRPDGTPVAVNDKYADSAQLDLARWARDAWQVPLHLLNDAHAAALGEWQVGAGQGTRSLVMLTLGTGIGGGVILGGRLLQGWRGQAGLLGALVMDLGGAADGVPGAASVWQDAEQLASPARIIAELRQEAAFAASALGRHPALDMAAVFAAAAAGDGLARRGRDRAISVWAAIVASAIHAYDPEAVILGGGIMQSAATILPALHARLEGRVLGGLQPVRLLTGTLGDDAALLGAAFHAEPAS